MLLWSIWKSRNINLWESRESTSVVIISRAKDSLHEWMCMQRAKPQGHSPNHGITWVKPQKGVLKCNVDATMFQNNVIIGYDLCFRTSMG